MAMACGYREARKQMTIEAGAAIIDAEAKTVEIRWTAWSWWTELAALLSASEQDLQRTHAKSRSLSMT
jgi:hypothetical protein